jgi:hypothetical protein
MAESRFDACFLCLLEKSEGHGVSRHGTVRHRLGSSLLKVPSLPSLPSLLSTRPLMIRTPPLFPLLLPFSGPTEICPSRLPSWPASWRCPALEFSREGIQTFPSRVLYLKHIIFRRLVFARLDLPQRWPRRLPHSLLLLVVNEQSSSALILISLSAQSTQSKDHREAEAQQGCCLVINILDHRFYRAS